jgi:hypothetical protein
MHRLAAGLSYKIRGNPDAYGVDMAIGLGMDAVTMQSSLSGTHQSSVGSHRRLSIA